MTTIFILSLNEAWESPINQGVFLTLEDAIAFSNENWKSKFKGDKDDPDFEGVDTPKKEDWRIAPIRKWESTSCGLIGVSWLTIEEFEVTPKGGK